MAKTVLETIKEKLDGYVQDYNKAYLAKSFDSLHEAETNLNSELKAYKKAAFSAEKHAANLDGLLAFRTRMINEGNPSSATLKKVFGEKGAEEFFVRCVMPDGEN